MRLMRRAHRTSRPSHRLSVAQTMTASRTCNVERVSWYVSRVRSCGCRTGGPSVCVQLVVPLLRVAVLAMVPLGRWRYGDSLNRQSLRRACRCADADRIAVPDSDSCDLTCVRRIGHAVSVPTVLCALRTGCDWPVHVPSLSPPRPSHTRRRWAATTVCGQDGVFVRWPSRNSAWLTTVRRAVARRRMAKHGPRPGPQ